MNKTVAEVKDFISASKTNLEKHENEIIICTPFTTIPMVTSLAANTQISVGAQNCHFENLGAYTGEISPSMLKELDVKYVILGHSERRDYFFETDELINKKIKSALNHSLKPILCVGETLEQRENNMQDAIISNQIKSALKMVKQTGYGVATPSIEDMKLDKPEIIKQGSRYGIKLKAKASSIHMIKVDVESTFEPIIGSELQSKELINYLTENKEGNDIWKSEIFGRSLDVIVQEGIQSKINMMPENIRFKLQQTLTKIVNRGSGNLIAIVL